jgi:hypothetical protein
MYCKLLSKFTAGAHREARLRSVHKILSSTRFYRIDFWLSSDEFALTIRTVARDLASGHG